MDKNTLSHYGGLVAVILVLAIMISLATPFASVIKDNVVKSVIDFKSNADGAMDSITVEASFDGLAPLDPPTLTIEGDELVIRSSSEGITEYAIYMNGTQVATVTAVYPETRFDLSSLTYEAETLSVVAETATGKTSKGSKIQVAVALAVSVTEHGTISVAGETGLTDYTGYIPLDSGTVTLTAVPDTGYKFAYWTRASSYIGSTASVSVLPLGSEVLYQPVFIEESATEKLYLNAINGIVGTGDTAPAIPAQFGYTADTWVSQGTTNGVEIFKPNYTKTSDTYTLTVNYSDGSAETQEYAFNDVVNLQAKDNNAKWVLTINGEDTVISYKENYTMRYRFDTDVTITETATGTTSDDVITGLTATYLSATGKIQFIGACEAPEGASVTNYGMLLSNNGSIASTMEIDTQGIVVGGLGVPTPESSVFGINKSKVTSGDTWYGRPFMVYTLNGESVVVYGDTVSCTAE